MDFGKYANTEGALHNPYSSYTNGKWRGGMIEAEWLNAHYGQYASLDECIENTNSKGLKLFFEHLKLQQ